MQERIITKGEVVQKKGQKNSKVYIVKSGLLRSYGVDEKGREHVFMFAPENWIIGDNCLPEDPCSLYIDALEDTVVYEREKDPSKEKDSLKLLRRLHKLQDRVMMLLSAPALDRYNHFINTYPEIAQRVPQKMIASYLGVTPETLSKLRRIKSESP